MRQYKSIPLSLILFGILFSNLTLFGCSGGREVITQPRFNELGISNLFYHGQTDVLDQYFHLGEIVLEVQIDSATLDPSTDSIVIRGKTLDGDTKETLGGVDVSYGIVTACDSSQSLKCHLKDVRSVATDSLGAFTLSFHLTTGSFLAGSIPGYMGRIYQVGRLLRH